MRSKVFIWCVLAAAAVLVSSLPSSAGWVLEDQKGATTVLSGGKLKSVAFEEGMWIVFDLEGETVTLVNAARKAYASGAPAEYCEAMKALTEDMMRQFPEMQKELERMKEGLISRPKVVVESQGSGGNVAGMRTEKFRVTAGGSLHEEVWIAKEAALNGELDGKKMSSMSRDLNSCMEAYFSTPSSVSGSDEYSRIYEKGWVLKSILYSPDGDPEAVNETVRIEKKSIPESEFQPPEGFTELSFYDLLQTGRMDRQPAPDH